MLQKLLSLVCFKKNSETILISIESQPKKVVVGIVVVVVVVVVVVFVVGLVFVVVAVVVVVVVVNANHRKPIFKV